MEKPGIFNVGAEEFGTLRDDLVSLIQHAKSRSKVIGLPVSLTIAILRIMDKLKLSNKRIPEKFKIRKIKIVDNE